MNEKQPTVERRNMEAKALQIVPRSEPTTALSVAEIKTMAEAVAESGLYPAIRTPAAAMTLMLLCQSEGIAPIQALRRYHIIEGRPSLNADAMLGDFLKGGGRVDWIKVTDVACEAKFTAANGSTHTVSWTMEDAKRAEMAGKSNWKKFPRQMLRARVISEGVRMMAPHIVTGTYTPEEVMDFDGPKGQAATTYTPPAISAVSSASSPVQSTGPSYVQADTVAEDVELVDAASDEMVWEYARENTRSPWEPVRQAEKASNAQLAAIHILKAKCKFTQALWKSRLMANFGVDTSALLSKRCASELIDKLEEKAAHQAQALERAHVEMEQGLAHVIAEEQTK